ncbi:MAG: hypothetical protein ACYCSW_10740 [bacterium]
MSEKSDILKKLIKINIVEINEESQKLSDEFRKSHEKEKMDESELEELLKITLKILEEIRVFKYAVDNVYETREIIGILKSIS